ncbi:MAG: hypothetical protein GEV10_10095 [Streptosporangiales bacterium]|nr:hypothetical protein [Streptosporangiales bacterium]
MAAVRRGVVVVAVAVLCAGCGQSVDAAAVRESAQAFLGAVRMQDGARACEVFAQKVVDDLTAGGGTCADELAQRSLDGDATISAVAVWGDRAQVKTSGDTLFLARYGAAWRVTAAGCRPRAEGPYECEVEA